jgi:hypothetical protein
MEKVSREFYHSWTNSVTTAERKFWKIADALFPISSMPNSFQYAL